MSSAKELAFEGRDYQTRLDRVTALARERGLDAFVTHTPENIYYLTGYHTLGYVLYQCLIVPMNGPPVLILRTNEFGDFLRYSYFDKAIPYGDDDDPVEVTASVLREHGLNRARVGLELDSWFLTTRNYLALSATMRTAEFVDAGGLVERCRVVKSPAEVSYMRAAARTAEVAMRAGIEAIHSGVIDNVVAAEIHHALYRAGSEYVSFPAFVGAGHKSTIGHGTWSSKRIERGESVILEIGGSVHRYNVALMRTVSIGPPSGKLDHMAKASNEANQALNEAIKPGVTARDVHRACQAVFEKAGLLHLRRVNRSGYSIGIAFPPDWGEGHILSLKESELTVLQPGMTFHTPSAIREYGVYGASYSETVLVTETGCERLTKFERQLFVRD